MAAKNPAVQAGGRPRFSRAAKPQEFLGSAPQQMLRLDQNLAGGAATPHRKMPGTQRATRLAVTGNGGL